MQTPGQPPAEHVADVQQQGKQSSSEWRGLLRRHALDTAMRKRAAGVPTYSVPETAALMSVSQEYLYRLIQADGFPAVRMRTHGGQGRYVVPAKAVERLLDAATDRSGSVESAEFTEQWRAGTRDGAA